MAMDPQLLQRFEQAGDAYRKQFGSGPPMLAFETMTMQQMAEAMEQAIATAQPVPGWKRGFETSIQHDTRPEGSPPLDSMVVHLRKR